MNPLLAGRSELMARRNTEQVYRSRGFSLIELMVSLVVLGILVGLAVPSYRAIIAEQRVRATVTDLHAAISLARSEAIKLNRQITIAPAAGGWAAGWGIAHPTAGQPALLAHTLSSGVGITGPNAGIVFSASGRTASAVEFEVSSDGSDAASVSCLSLGLDGRASSSKGEC
jgi:type IV fimbrial biogenesis protein FimT